jgi:hypothetical protein
MSAAGVRLGFANLDLCGNLSVHLVHDLLAVKLSRCWAEEACVAVTMLRGRESAEANSVIERYSQALWNDGDQMVDCYRLAKRWGMDYSSRAGMRDFGRLAVLWGVLGAHPIRAGSYWSPSARQTMLWSVFKLGEPAGFTFFDVSGFFPSHADAFRRTLQYAERTAEALEPRGFVCQETR